MLKVEGDNDEIYDVVDPPCCRKACVLVLVLATFLPAELPLGITFGRCPIGQDVNVELVDVKDDANRSK